MPVTSLLIANRGEIAIRIARAAAAAGVRSVAVFSEDDARSLHVVRADEVRALRGSGPAAYLDADQIIVIARESGCDAVHPGYGFLSENADFADACAQAGVTFIGPSPDALRALGDKTRARVLAAGASVPVIEGTGPASLDDVRAFGAGVRAPIAIKAVAGGGGRGMRIVRAGDDIAAAYERCVSEARAAFGDGAVYAERAIGHARHIEVQVLGDATGAISHLWERDCTLQRRNQKLIEIAPAPALDPPLRARIIDAALAVARAAALTNAATIEFLVREGDFWFIEANPRLQVEHTVTEAITGTDIVRAQIALAGGATLASLGMAQDAVPAPRGFAVQARVNMETLLADGTVRPNGGTITAYDPPGGPGIRVDGFAYAGYTTSSAFDSLLGKVIAHAPDGDAAAALALAARALGEMRVDGVETNIPLLRALLSHPDVTASRAHTLYIDEHAATLAANSPQPAPPPAATDGFAGARIDARDPLAVLDHGKSANVEVVDTPDATAPDGHVLLRAPMQGTIVAIDVAVGDVVRPGQRVLIMEAMKMEHVIAADAGGIVRRLLVATGDAVMAGRALAEIEPADVGAAADDTDEEIDLDAIRPDLAEVLERHRVGLDDARETAVARRHATAHRTARENIDDLVDPGSFIEYGALTIAAQRRRRTVEDLIANTPGDGLVAGIGTVNGDIFGPEAARCIAMSYDYMVLAGTQGAQNHRKKDRMFELAEKWRLPIVFFTEGGGGRPGDTDGLGVAGLDVMAFHYFGRLSGLVPLVGITSGRCFAGNAALLGCSDVVIATRDANIGMGGPAMIEGGGLGIFRPEEVGPTSVQWPNGVIDILVDDEAAAVRAAKQYLSYFQGASPGWSAGDQRLLRSAIPENRRRIYDVRHVIETMSDAGSVLELRGGFGAGMVTALARIEGRAVGIIANNPAHLAGAIDSDGADKASRFMQLCDAFAIPLLLLCDTPGIMVGPEAEKTALVRHAARMFVTGASVTVPLMTIVLRKGYGLGAQAMAGGSFKASGFTVAWPTGEFGGMGLEGAVKLGYRNELAAIDDREKRRALFDEMVERMYRHGKAVNAASHFEIDDVIDPADSRRWIATALRSMPLPERGEAKRRPAIDTW